MKIYKIITHSGYEGSNNVNVKVFTDKDKALKYLQEEIHTTECDVADPSEYDITKSITSYTQYRKGYSSTDYIKIYLEEDVVN